MSNLLAFAAIAVVIIVIPGPSVLFTIGRALAVGRRSALLTVAGNAVGVALQVVAVAFGLGALVERSVTAFTVIKIIGAAYILYLGVQAIRHRHAISEALGRQTDPIGSRRALLDGLVVGAMNPKTIVVLAAVMPAFADAGTGSVPLQLLAMGAVFPVVGVLSDGLWAVAAGTARAWLARSPRRLALVGGTGGLLMIGIGLNVAITGRSD
jgi:threonine/homoserine/homoserine lactone efflux protein